MYRLKISGEQFQSEIEGAQDWSRSVLRDFQDRLFRTRGEYRFVGHKGLYNLLYNHMAANGVCEALTGRIYFNGGDAWDYEWKGEIKPQDCEFDIFRRSVDTQVLDDSWAAKFHNAKDQKVFLRSTESKNGVFIGECNSELVLIFNPTTGAYDADFRRLFKMYDVFDFLVKYYSDGTVTFASDYLSTGDGQIYFITTGAEIRAVNEAANPEVSFSDAFDEMNKKLNLWIIIEGTPDAPVLRIEPWDYVFQELKVVEIRDPEGLKLKIDLDQLYTTINVGSASTPFNVDDDAHYPDVFFQAWGNESYNTTGACQFENNVLDLVSTWKIDNNSIEQQYASVGSDTGPFDSDIFLIDVEQIGGAFFAIRYTTDFTADGTVPYIYNETLINENVILRWFDGIPQVITKVLNRRYYALVNTITPIVVTVGTGDPDGNSYEDIIWTNDSVSPAVDVDDIYTTPAEASGDDSGGEFKAPVSGIYRYFVTVDVDNPVIPKGIGLTAHLYTDNTRARRIGKFFGGGTWVTGPTTLVATWDIYMNADEVVVLRTYENTPAVPITEAGYDRTGGYATVESVNKRYIDSSASPFIYIYDMARHQFTPAEFDLIDQGRGFVRIIDSLANRAYDVWAKDVRYNRWTNIIQGEFIGRQAPIELCWILDSGYWDDDCFWNDDDFWNEPAFRPFIITVDTTNAGVSANDAFRLPTTGGGYNYTVDWGDGQVDYGQTGTREHTYGAPGTYTIKVYGDFPRIHFDNTDDCLKLISIDQWGDVIWDSMTEAFYGCANMTANYSDAPNLVITESLSYMFALCSSFTADFNNWDTSTITIANSMLNGCTVFNGELNSLDTSSVINFSDFLRNCIAFNQPLSNLDTTSAENMFFFLGGATSFDQNIGNWTIENVNNLVGFLSGVTISTANYDALLIGWTGWSGGMPTKTVQPNLTPNFGGSTYSLGTDAEDARNYLTGTEGWTITDGGGV